MIQCGKASSLYNFRKKQHSAPYLLNEKGKHDDFYENFGQCHVFYFLDSHFHLLGYQIAAVSPISLLVTNGIPVTLF